MASSMTILPSHHQTRITSGATASSSSSSSSSLLLRPRPRPLTTPNALTVRLEDGSGRTIQVDDAEFVIGSDASKVSLALAGSGVAPVHARLTQKRRGISTATQVFLTALVDLDEGVLGNSRTWLDGQPLRPGVQYVIGSGQRVEMGERGGGGGASGGGSASAAFTVEFTEGSGRDPLVEMMMAGMAGSQGAKLKDALSSE